MVKTQFHLTSKQQQQLAAIARARGKRQSEVIREAVVAFLDATARVGDKRERQSEVIREAAVASLEQHVSSRRHSVLRAAAGIWKNRTDLAPLSVLRNTWDRC